MNHAVNYALHGAAVADGALVLAPGQRTVLASIGAGWDATTP